MNLDEDRMIRKQGIKLRVRGIGAAKICAGQASQRIRDDVLFTGFMLNIQPELLKELRRPDKAKVHPYGRCCQSDWRLLEDIQNGWVIGSNDDAGSAGLD